jgi:predicted TIM-barrel fold metal-dependent hydrolase
MSTPAPLGHASRRQFLTASLRTTGASLIAQLMPGCATVGTSQPGLIDAHVHIWTPDTKSYPLAEGFTVAKDMKPASFTPEELFAQCKPEGVNRIVLIQMSFYKYDNRYMLDMMEKHDDVFSGVAIVDENKADVCDTMKSLGKQDVRGFRIYTSAAQAAAWGEGMKKMWSCAADNGQAMCLLADPESLPIVHKWCAQYPKTRVVIDHFARIGMKGPVKPTDLDNLRRLAKFSNVYVKTSAFYALGKKQAPYADIAPLIQSLRDTFGAQRLMWASDCPFQVQDGHTYANSVALVRDRLDFLSAEDKSWMLRKTAEKVFFA